MSRQGQSTAYACPFRPKVVGFYSDLPAAQTSLHLSTFRALPPPLRLSGSAPLRVRPPFPGPPFFLPGASCPLSAVPPIRNPQSAIRNVLSPPIDRPPRLVVGSVRD